ncbi:MAG TPA: hypothetical protein VLA02_06965 [Reyranella sp.]|nr:hypothetical protein [Reyranella sp.]
MWILTWIAVGIGGALGAASVMVVSATRHHSGPAPSIIAGTQEPVFITKHKTGESGRSVIAASRRSPTSIE